MDKLQVPTRRITVEVFTTDGARAHGVLYVTESRVPTDAPGEIVRILNDERRFVPFLADGADGEVLLHKDHIVRVHVQGEAADEFEEPAPPPDACRPCTLTLADGTRLQGRLFAETPPAMNRLIDKLNQTPRSLSFVVDGGIDFVHADQVVRAY